MKYASLWILLLSALLLGLKQPDNKLVTGTVVNENGQPLSGATVREKGSNNATVTDSVGVFSLQVKSDNPVLEVTMVGFESQEMSMKKQSTIKVILHLRAMVLDEVQVIGYAAGVSVKSEAVNRRDKRRSLPMANALAYRVQPSPGVSGAINGGRARLSDADNYYYKKPAADLDREGYEHIEENPYLKVSDNPLSTFSIDVDAASYSNIRRFITDGQLPPAGAVRIEEMINYFTYQYPQPTADIPFSVNTEITACPWNPQHKLALVGLQGRKIPTDNLPASNMVFLIDVSGSMQSDNKLPLVKSSLALLTDQLRPQDRVAIVVYAGNAGLVLPSTSGDEKMKIKAAINSLEAGGSTAGGAGIQLAYKVAAEHLVKKGNNRIVLCTDGDFNVGASSDDELVRMIEKERETGIFLTVLGYGMGNYQDAKMQQLADKGNGNHAYIDGISEANKVLVNEFGGTLFTIAKDVKLQIEFNPSLVQGYRLIGYENRLLAKEDFNNDKKDAGELGSGHTVTALYEIIPAGAPATELNSVDKLRYQQPEKTVTAKTTFSGELMNIKLRYKEPDGATSRLLEKPVKDEGVAFRAASENFRFAASVAAFGMKLRDSRYQGTFSYNDILETARKSLGADKENYRKEFVQMVGAAKDIQARTQPADDREEREKGGVGILLHK